MVNLEKKYWNNETVCISDATTNRAVLDAETGKLITLNNNVEISVFKNTKIFAIATQIEIKDTWRREVYLYELSEGREGTLLAHRLLKDKVLCGVYENSNLFKIHVVEESEKSAENELHTYILDETLKDTILKTLGNADINKIKCLKDNQALVTVKYCNPAVVYLITGNKCSVIGEYQFIHAASDREGYLQVIDDEDAIILLDINESGELEERYKFKKFFKVGSIGVGIMFNNEILLIDSESCEVKKRISNGKYIEQIWINGPMLVEGKIEWVESIVQCFTDEGYKVYDHYGNLLLESSKEVELIHSRSHGVLAYMDKVNGSHRLYSLAHATDVITTNNEAVIGRVLEIESNMFFSGEAIDSAAKNMNLTEEEVETIFTEIEAIEYGKYVSGDIVLFKVDGKMMIGSMNFKEYESKLEVSFDDFIEVEGYEPKDGYSIYIYHSITGKPYIMEFKLVGECSCGCAKCEKRCTFTMDNIEGFKAAEVNDLVYELKHHDVFDFSFEIVDEAMKLVNSIIKDDTTV